MPILITQSATRTFCFWSLFLCSAFILNACGKKETELGEGGSVVSGSAGPAGAHGADKALTRCDAPIATLSLVENPNGYRISGNYQLPSSPVPLIRLIAQQSGCFRIMDRSAGLNAAIKEYELKASGIIRENSTLQKGRGYEAQYSLTPSLNFSEKNAGQGMGSIIGMIPILKDISGLGGIVEQVKFKEAQTTLLLTDNETTEQLAAATGSAKSTDLGGASWLLSRMGGAGGAGWSNTNEAKVIAAAFFDAHNKLVVQLRQLQAKEMPPPVPVKKG